MPRAAARVRILRPARPFHFPIVLNSSAHLRQHSSLSNPTAHCPLPSPWGCRCVAAPPEYPDPGGGGGTPLDGLCSTLGTGATSKSWLIGPATTVYGPDPTKPYTSCYYVIDTGDTGKDG